MAENEIINKILDSYDEKRQRAAKKRREKIEEVYLKYPRIHEIDNEMNRLGMENIQKILKDGKNHEKYNAELNENLERLEKERDVLLEKYNIPKNFKEYEYECALCSDTGYTPDGKKCVCFKQSVMNERYNSSNIGHMMKKFNFDTFSFDMYSKDKGSYMTSPYDNIQRIYKRTRDFCNNFDSMNKSMLFYGKTGLGKTFLSCAAGKELIEQGKTVAYIRAGKLFSTFEDYRFGRLQDKSVIDNLYSCDLLIIDDLGTESSGKMNNSTLFDIFDERTTMEKKLIISTNLDLSELGKRYSMRFMSRVMENCIVCHFIGEDIRYKMME